MVSNRRSRPTGDDPETAQRQRVRIIDPTGSGTGGQRQELGWPASRDRRLFENRAEVVDMSEIGIGVTNPMQATLAPGGCPSPRRDRAQDRLILRTMRVHTRGDVSPVLGAASEPAGGHAVAAGVDPGERGAGAPARCSVAPTGSCPAHRGRPCLLDDGRECPSIRECRYDITTAYGAVGRGAGGVRDRDTRRRRAIPGGTFARPAQGTRARSRSSIRPTAVCSAAWRRCVTLTR